MTAAPEPPSGEVRGAPRAGEIVRVRDERWRVVHVTPYEACSVVVAAGAEPSNAGGTARFLFPFEPFDRVARRGERPRVVRPATWRRAARAVLSGETPGWASLRAAANANVSLLAYQLEPALAMLRGLASRVLLADEVGLGKTIQAGLIAAELVEREGDARVLVVTPAALRDQWRDELRDRFAIEASIVDAAALARASASLPAGVNPWSIPNIAITSIDFLKRADVIRALEPLAWDLVVFDEAHALAGRSDRALAADLVAERARRVAIVTATPHSGDERAFERLCAIGRLGGDDPLLTFRRSRAEAGLERLRAMRRIAVTPTREEGRMHRALAAYAARVAREAPPEGAAAARLAMLVLARRASSSAASLARSVERRMTLLREPPAAAGAQLRLPIDDAYVGDDDEPIEELAAPGLASARTEERRLEEILRLARGVGEESKLGVLRRLLRRAGEPAIVFTEYRDTLGRLASALPVETAMLHGGLTSAERAREVRRFTHGDARVLLATDAASEGLNLQRRCRLVVNLDVPWTPLRLEQRIGRVDRLGQSRRVHAVTLLARGTAEAFVASRLHARSARAERDAPFGPSTAGPALAAEARAEAARLATARALAARRRARPHADRPVVAAVGRGRGASLWLLVRLSFEDATGASLWTTVNGIAFPAVAPLEARWRLTRAWFDGIVEERGAGVAAASLAMHDTRLAALRSDLQAALSRLLARERAILGRLTGDAARLAAPLIDVGLFDRRALRERDAQRRIAEEAATRAGERMRRLERQMHPRAGGRELVLAVAWRR